MRPRTRGELVPVPLVDGALAHALQRNGCLGGEQAHRDLAAPHFQGEEDRRLVVADRCGAGEVERQRRLTERWAGGDDDELAAVEAVGQVVHLGEAGRACRTSRRRDPLFASISSKAVPTASLSGT